MPTIIFVHGTGVRKEAYAESFGAIRRELAGLKGWEVRPCLWGDEHGAQLGKGGISIPDFDATRKEEALSEEERGIALWAALYEDPLYELRLLELKPRSLQYSVFNQSNLFQQFDPLVRRLAQTESLTEPLQACQLDQVWKEAVGELVASPEYRGALAQAERADTELREVIARALVSLALRRRGRKTLFEPMSGAARDALVGLIVESLGGRDQGALAWLGRLALAKPFTSYVRRNRGQLSADGFAVAGDILLYQARGQGIRDLIHQTIASVEPPVVLLAHSLGGIACVDLLNERDLSDRVPLLITAGSQAPFLYEMNALASLPFREPLKSWFPRRWLNIYDPRDFLSYLARGVFDGPEIEDLRVDNREPFPQSHGAYWSNARVWNAIREEMQKITR
ncbi:MAG: hypothetical protein ACREEM_38325 [Blastocatellia bacterium]